MKKLSISLVLLFVLTISACAVAPPQPGSLAEMRQQARKAIESDCLNALWLKERRTIYYAVSGGLVDVFGYCNAYARSRVESRGKLPRNS